MQSSLRAPGDLDHPRVLAGLSVGQAVTDSGLMAVMVGGFDQQPAGVDRSGFGDRPLPPFEV
jgi:hypothetical protein